MTTATVDRQELVLKKRLADFRETARAIAGDAERLARLARVVDREVTALTSARRVELDKAENPRRAMR